MESKYFKVKELVPLNIVNVLNEQVLWNMIDDSLIETIDTLKEVFDKGTITINNYLWGGDRGWSGLRTIGSPYYSKTSMHSVGKAVDCIFSGYDVEEVRQYILDNPDKFPHVGGIELGVSWLHVDVRDRVNGSIVTFYP